MKENCLNCNHFVVCRVVDKVIDDVRIRGGWVEEMKKTFETEGKSCTVFEPLKKNV